MARKPTKGKKANNRIRPLISRQYGTEESDVVMNDLAYVLMNSVVRVPVPGNFYVFIYYAQKPQLLTDRYPIIACTGLYEWGFSGINRHIDEPRNYNFSAVAGEIYQIKPQELESALALPLMDLKQNNR